MNTHLSQTSHSSSEGGSSTISGRNISECNQRNTVSSASNGQCAKQRFAPFKLASFSPLFSQKTFRSCASIIDKECQRAVGLGLTLGTRGVASVACNARPRDATAVGADTGSGTRDSRKLRPPRLGTTSVANCVGKVAQTVWRTRHGQSQSSAYASRHAFRQHFATARHGDSRLRVALIDQSGPPRSIA